MNPRTLALLARAGALNALATHRREAHWRAIGIEQLPGMLAGASAREPHLALPAPNEAQEIIADYQGLGLTLGRHPVGLLRAKLTKRGVRRSADLHAIPNGARVRVAGLVTHRQRPETASGVVFMSLEDECGVTNLIVWPSVQTAQRKAVFASRLLIVQGQLQSESGVTHVIARQLSDYSHWLGSLPTYSRDFH